MSPINEIKNLIVSLISNLGFSPAITNVIAVISLVVIGFGILIASPGLALVIAIALALALLR